MGARIRPSMGTGVAANRPCVGQEQWATKNLTKTSLVCFGPVWWHPSPSAIWSAAGDGDDVDTKTLFGQGSCPRDADAAAAGAAGPHRPPVTSCRPKCTYLTYAHLCLHLGIYRVSLQITDTIISEAKIHSRHVDWMLRKANESLTEQFEKKYVLESLLTAGHILHLHFDSRWRLSIWENVICRVTGSNWISNQRFQNGGYSNFSKNS